ncbi:MAG: hypothetical protein IJC73_00350 [Lentisphaeria bacterium]|nr:hypothetical protein [Lentisphaeria bacterium]
MTKHFLTFTVPVIAAVLLLSAGCERSESPEGVNPAERNQLILRLFESMDKRDYAASSQQAVKLRALDPGSIFLSRMVDIQTGNYAVVQAQERLDAGDFKAAAQQLDEAARRNPLYREMEAESRAAARVAEMAQMVAGYRELRLQKVRWAATRENDERARQEYVRALTACARQLHRIGTVARQYDFKPLIRAAEREFALINRESVAEQKRFAAAKAARAQKEAAGPEPAGDASHAPVP